jgi:hypothetical protein
MYQLTLYYVTNSLTFTASKKLLQNKKKKSNRRNSHRLVCFIRLLILLNTFTNLILNLIEEFDKSSFDLSWNKNHYKSSIFKLFPLIKHKIIRETNIICYP